MDVTTLCAVVATLAVLPDRSQFFRHESVSLSCGQQGNSSSAAWRVMKSTTSAKAGEECHTSGDAEGDGSHCFIDFIYPFDSGLYWCESAAGECSNALNISVTGGTVILDVPVRPVAEGDLVTLRCRNRTSPSSGLASRFYKGELFIGASATGSLTIAGVTEASRGLYKCSIPGAGESSHSWLEVAAGHRETPGARTPRALILLPVAGSFLSLALVTLLCLWRRRKGGGDTEVSYTDVTLAQEALPRRIRDTDHTFYSMLNLAST